MSISDLGSIGELVGAIGVIASLIYLAAQVRGARRVARAQNVRQVFDGLRRTLGLVAADAETAELWSRGHNSPDALSDVDRLRFESVLADYVLMYREAQVAHGEGMLSDQDHDRLRALVATLLNSEGGSRAWSAIERAFSEDLRGALNEARIGLPAYRPGAEFPRLSPGDPGRAP